MGGLTRVPENKIDETHSGTVSFQWNLSRKFVDECNLDDAGKVGGISPSWQLHSAGKTIWFCHAMMTCHLLGSGWGSVFGARPPSDQWLTNPILPSDPWQPGQLAVPACDFLSEAN